MDRAKFYLVWIGLPLGCMAFWVLLVLTVKGGLT